MRRLSLVLGAILLLAPSASQAVSRGYIYSIIGSGVTCSSTCPSWSGSAQMATIGDFTGNFNNNGTCGSPSNKLIVYGTITSCATNSSVHSPLLANNSFASGGSPSFASWVNTSGAWSAVATSYGGLSPEDADGGLAENEGTYLSPTKVTLSSASFTISGTPTSQSYSFYYGGAYGGSGATCPPTAGTVSNLELIVNGTIVKTISSVSMLAQWAQATGSMTALVSGSNSVQFVATMTSGYALTLVGELCKSPETHYPVAVDIDNVVLQASY